MTRTQTLTPPPTNTPSVTPTGTPTPFGLTLSVDYTAKGYFTQNPTTLNDGMPSASYLPLPSTLTYAQLAQLQQDCVDRINMYRSGALKFSDGSSDPGVPKPLVTHLMGNDVCAAEIALGDLSANNFRGGCAAAHTNAFSCPGGNRGQNTCCFRSGNTYSAIRSQLFSCLQQMWDEGRGLPDNTAFSGSNGHWYNMRRADVAYVECGFAFATRSDLPSGGLWMNQDFLATAGSVPVTCSCAGKSFGDPDGCGGTCVAN